MTMLEREPLWTGQDMADAMDARPVRSLPERIEGISIDSRTVKPGDAFFAIKGDRVDGHDYATKAAGAGAALLVVSEDKLAAMGRLTVPLLVVSDVLEAMRKLARASRARSKARIVAVTGSAGKTTTKDALAHMLSRQGETHASAASFNNHWGVPLTLARMPATTRFGVFEIGMNHHGEITPLVKLVRPHVSVITLIAAAHLGHFKDLDDIAKAKAEIFAGLVNGGTALLNGDDPRFELLSDHARAYGVTNIGGYGEASGLDVHLLAHTLMHNGSTIKASVYGLEVAAKIGMPGRHVVQNMLGALGVAKLLGADVQEAAKSLSDLNPSPGRGEHFRLAMTKGTLTLIDESYNANPASMKAALETMRNIPVKGKGRRIAVLGDMLEMGAFAAEQHAGLADLVMANAVDEVYLFGPEMRALADALAAAEAPMPVRHFTNLEDLSTALGSTLHGGDVVTVKASNGTGLGRLVTKLRNDHPLADD